MLNTHITYKYSNNYREGKIRTLFSGQIGGFCAENVETVLPLVALYLYPNPTLKTTSLMKRKLLTLTAFVALVAVYSTTIALRQRTTIHRLTRNQTTLTEQLRLSDSATSAERLSVGRLRLTVGELEELHREDAERIRSLGIALRRTQSTSLAATTTHIDTTATPLTTPSDSIGHTALLNSITSRYEWSDEWVRFSASVEEGVLNWNLTSRDTLFQVVHRVPHRWWIFRWGTKAIRQEIRSSNPHTHLTYAEYVEIEN